MCVCAPRPIGFQIIDNGPAMIREWGRAGHWELEGVSQPTGEKKKMKYIVVVCSGSSREKKTTDGREGERERERGI